MATQLHSPENSTTPPHVEGRVTSQCDENLIQFEGDACDLVSDNVRLVFQILNFVIIVQIIDIFGTGTNIINIICFVKQGLKDPVNIALLGLTVSDLISMAVLIWQNLALNPLFYESDLPFFAPNLAHLTGGCIHVASTRVTCCITAFVTLERCLCVVSPLKVQLIFSARRVTIIVITIYIIILSGNMAPVYYSTRFTTVPHPHKPNTTWLGIAFTADQPLVEKYSFPINNCVIPFLTFTIISVSTVIMTKELRRKTKWRQKSTASKNSDSLSSRDKSLTKMIVVISTMFIICYTPICLTFIGMVAVPQFSILGQYKNLNSIVVSFSYLLEAINASFNIFIYYNMSSRYRQAFRKMFPFPRSRDRHDTFTKLE